MTHVIIGRFQVPALHAGHRKLIDEAYKQADRLIIFIGVAPFILTKRNPLTFDMVKCSVKEYLRVKGFKQTLVLPLPDRRDDADWSSRLDTVLETICHGDMVKFYTGRDGFDTRYTGKFPVTQMLFGVHTSSTTVRKGLKPSNEDYRFREGVVWAIENQYPLASVCVDAIVTRNMATLEGVFATEVLLVRKHGESKFRFPGGFVDVDDTSLEHSIRRELREETDLPWIGEPKYLFSTAVNDWRSKITTVVFQVPDSVGPSCNLADNPEIAEQKWFTDNDVVLNLTPEHSEIWEKAIGLI